MRCECGCKETLVTNKRIRQEGRAFWRRRECKNCGKRYTTYELILTEPIKQLLEKRFDFKFRAGRKPTPEHPEDKRIKQFIRKMGDRDA